MSDIKDFGTLGLSSEMLSALKLKGFSEPTPIQSLTIPKLLNGSHDLIGQAQTGTGKTAAFGIPIIERSVLGARKPQALILAPTRELSMQIAEEINSFKGGKKLRIVSFYGGQSIEIQLQILRQGNVDIVIGTPGRIIDLHERGELDFSELKYAVLDEADEMLDMGFIEDIELILGATNSDKRTLMFSATMPDEVLGIAEKFMGEYEIVRTAMVQMSTELADQIYYEVRREDKFDALMRIIDTEENLYALVFCRTKGDVDEVVEKLKQHRYPVEALHGDVAQSLRTRVINRFKNRYFPILVATDVAARGIDVNDLTHVINYSIPQNHDIYIHRVGRTGRAGKEGKAITFVTPGEIRRIRSIQSNIKNEIRKEQLPDGRAVVELKKRRYIEKLSQFRREENEEYLSFARELLDNAYVAEELLAAILQNHFKDELLERRYRDFSGKKKDRAYWENSVGRINEVKLILGIGKLDGFGAVKIMNLFRDLVKLRRDRIGKIDCQDHRTFVYLDNDDARQVIAAFRSDPDAPLIDYAPVELSETDIRKSRRGKVSVDSAVRKSEKSVRKKDSGVKRSKGMNYAEKLASDIRLKEKRQRAKKSKAKDAKHPKNK